MFKKFTQWFDNPPPHVAPENHLCDYQGCTVQGIYRAPKSRDQLERGKNDWYWLCLPHIRLYNQSWNYYSHMTESEIVQERHSDITWDRPTWSFSSPSKQPPFQDSFQDPFGFFNTSRLPVPSLNASEQESLKLLDLNIPFTRQELRTNYRKLVKKYHPDTNQNNPKAEQMIRKLNQAYACLQKMVSDSTGK